LGIIIFSVSLNVTVTQPSYVNMVYRSVATHKTNVLGKAMLC